MRPLVLGTAGHIDHGKTALVRALTGSDTDRLPDEKRRGITIDLGFAHLTLPGGRPLSVIDVPGHEAFIRNMVAGATGIDLALLVIAADEGPMPQTHEHVSILEHLGIGIAAVALTKTDVVEPEWLELVRDDVVRTLQDTALAASPVIDVSARTGQGIPLLLARLAELADSVPDRTDDDLFRMPVDRVFTVRGTGTVVTGTVWSGSLTRDTQVRILPGDATARVRGLQQHGVACESVGAGSRAAIALTGVDRQDLERGHTLVTDSTWQAASIITAQVRLDAATLRPRQRVRVHLGTAEVLARVALLPEKLEPGSSAIVQLRCEEPLVARAGDRFVLRSYSPVHTIGGGTVLEPNAPKRRRLRPAIHAALEALVEHPGAGAVTNERAPSCLAAAVALADPDGLPADRLPVLAGLTPAIVGVTLPRCEAVARVGATVVDRAALESTEALVLDHVARFHEREPMMDGLPRETLRRELGAPALFDAALARLLSGGVLVAAGNALADPSHSAAPDADAVSAMDRIASIFVDAGLEPPELTDLPDDLKARPDLARLLQFLERDGRIMRLTGDRFISVRAVTDGVEAVRTQLARGQALGISDFRQVMNLSRKHLIPLLEHFDRTGVTRRSGETRVLAE